MELPEEVRPRLVSLVAACLDDVTPLPPALKRVAGFAPARRARLGAAAIVTSLSEDDELRARVATRVRTRAGGDADDAADVGALSWLERGEGWQETLADAVRRLEARVPQRAADDARLARLQERADEAERALREQRRTHREALDSLKAEVATLRRTLGETRSRDRSALEEAAAARAAAEALAARLERELRQARAQAARLEAAAAEAKRQVRSDRDEVTVRTRLLLETLDDAATGLRRELALPPSSGNPADRLEATLAAEGGAREPSSTGSMDRGSPALLEQYLALPRPRLLIDGYNVTKAVWPSSSLEAQRIRLLAQVAPLVARTGAETTVVFDAAASESRPLVSSPRGVRVLFSPPGVIADDVLRELVAAEPGGRVVVVVTDDRELADDVRRGGARVVGTRALA